tara:strand:+ start:4990 stop:5196 length:207 start_codon:yes stop_codon:yes gene_type:complete
MKFNIDIKTLIFIISTACIGAGYYYTTESRLSGTEREISWLGGQVRALKAENKRIYKLITKIRKEKFK